MIQRSNLYLRYCLSEKNDLRHKFYFTRHYATMPHTLLKYCRYHRRPSREASHLPDMPSAEEVATKGYSQHEINKALLQKIEELTLYIIEQNKEIDKLKKLVKEPQ